MARITRRFEALKARNESAFVPFVMGGDPSYEASLSLLKALPAAGADIIEIGLPFTDPMADGAAIQAAGLRALNAGQTLVRTLDLVRAFRAEDDETPIVLMGYFNPIYAYGITRFVADAAAAGVDGLIVVDLPPEEDDELAVPAAAGGLDFIRLVTPTTDEKRLPAVLKLTSGFLYYVSVAGVTGGKTGAADSVDEAVMALRAASSLPIAVGFGIRTEARAAEVARLADAVVVGSALVDELAAGFSVSETAAIKNTLALARKLAEAIKTARVDRVGTDA